MQMQKHTQEEKMRMSKREKLGLIKTKNDRILNQIPLKIKTKKSIR